MTDNTASEIDFTEEQKQRMKEKDITEDEVGDCIKDEMAEGIDQDQAVAICLSKLESGSAKPNETNSLENPEFEVGDFVMWEFGDGQSQGEIIDMTAEPGDSMSAGGNEFTVDEPGGENDVPLYKIEEWDETEGEEGEFTNNAVKFEDELNEENRPEAAERSVDTQLSMQERLEQAKEKEDQVKRISIDAKDIQVVKNQDGAATLNVPIQALSEDRDGDFIDEKGQESIIKQLNSGEVGLFPNHGVGNHDAVYDYRDLFGKFVEGDNNQGTTIGKAVLRQVEDPETDTDDMKLHPMAKELVNLLEQEMPVGFSVGFIPKEAEPREQGGGDKISELDLMEVSAVGIPSNPDAMPAAMSQAASETAGVMAKQMVEAGFQKDEIVNQVSKAVKNTMSEKQEQDGTDQKEDSKSELKQLDDDQIEMITAVVGDNIDRHMTAALEDIQQDLMNDRDEEVEEDEMDEDEDMDEDAEHGDEDEDMSQHDASDQTEDSEKDESAESEDKGLDEDQKTVSDDKEEGRKMNTIDESQQDEKSEEQEDNSDPFAVRNL